MDWFKRNPFLAGLLVATVLAVASAAYYLNGALARFAAEEETFMQNQATLQGLQGAKPFPNADNVAKAKEELADARRVLADIAQAVKVAEPAVTPTAFQDELRDKVSDISTRAAAAGVALGSDFFLGFDAYQAQPPTEAAAPKLALQLQSIHKVVSILLDARVREIVSIKRESLPVESASPAPSAGEGKGTKPQARPSTDELPDFNLAPFTVVFGADQSSFRTAFNRILDIEPPVFVRMVGVANSQPEGPSKTPEGATSATAFDGAESLNKPVVGREVLTVTLQLASISADAGSPAKK